MIVSPLSERYSENTNKERRKPANEIRKRKRHFTQRSFGASAEGVSYAIIISNLLVPLIENVTVPRPFGIAKEKRSSNNNKEEKKASENNE